MTFYSIQLKLEHLDYGKVVNCAEYPNYEIIVINDDSDDERYYEYNFQDPVKIFHIKKSETPDWGGARNPLRNIGVEKSSGKYIAFLDDDDIWLEGKLKKQVALLGKYLE